MRGTRPLMVVLSVVVLVTSAACASAAERQAASLSSAAAAASSIAEKSALVDRALGITSWPPADMDDAGDVAWRWTQASEVSCKSYQDGCYGITVAAKYGCPSGVYIELAIIDTSGAAVDRANEITAGLGQGDVAKAVLSPPGGSPSGAKAKVTKLNCLG